MSDIVKADDVLITEDDWAKLDQRQMKYIELSATGYFSEKDIMTRLGLSSYLLKKYKSDPVLNRILAWKKKSIVEATVNQQSNAIGLITQKATDALLERFDPLDEEDLEGLSERERVIKMRTRVENMTPQELSKMLIDLNRHNQELSHEAVVAEEEVVERIRLQYSNRRKEEFVRKQALSSHGFEDEAQIFELLEFDANGNIVPVTAPQVDELELQEVEVERTVTTRKKEVAKIDE